VSVLTQDGEESEKMQRWKPASLGLSTARHSVPVGGFVSHCRHWDLPSSSQLDFGIESNWTGERKTSEVTLH
jgi:hypothetical protein